MGNRNAPDTARLPGRLAVGFVVAVVSCALAQVSPASAFDPYQSPSKKSCTECHGRESDEVSGTIAATRKGPHGRYKSTTRKCSACHGPHSATGRWVLRAGTTIKDACESCHDGSGGKGVYGVIKARTGLDPVATHSIEETNTIPSGETSGGPRVGGFYGPSNTMTCVDCHSPHDSNTVEPFTGDRPRAPQGEETATALAVPTNRLLKKLTREDGTSVERYGSDWCAACHRGYHLPEAGDDPSGRHPVAFDSDGDWYYDRVRIVAGVETTSTEWGSLGSSNRGYLMPHVPGSPTTHFGPQLDAGPICQQCHEDARDVEVAPGDSPMLGSGKEFRVTHYPNGGAEPDPADSPRFQSFPHESDQPRFRVIRSDPFQPPLDGFCTRCHMW